MDFRMADTFTDAVARLAAAEQKAAKCGDRISIAQFASPWRTRQDSNL